MTKIHQARALLERLGRERIGHVQMEIAVVDALLVVERDERNRIKSLIEQTKATAENREQRFILAKVLNQIDGRSEDEA